MPQLVDNNNALFSKNWYVNHYFNIPVVWKQFAVDQLACYHYYPSCSKTVCWQPTGTSSQCYVDQLGFPVVRCPISCLNFSTNWYIEQLRCQSSDTLSVEYVNFYSTFFDVFNFSTLTTLITTALILLKRMPRVFYLSLAPSALQNHWPPIYCICLLSCRKIFMFCPGLFVFIWLLSSAQILITLIKSWSNQKKFIVTNVDACSW